MSGASALLQEKASHRSDTDNTSSAGQRVACRAGPMAKHVALTHRTRLPLRPAGRHGAARGAPAAGAALPHADPQLFAAHRRRRRISSTGSRTRSATSWRAWSCRSETRRASRSRSISSPTWPPSIRSTSSSRRRRPAGRSPTSRCSRASSSPTCEPLPARRCWTSYLARHRAHGAGRRSTSHRASIASSARTIAYRVRMEPGVQTPEETLASALGLVPRLAAGCWCRSCATSASRRASCPAT